MLRILRLRAVNGKTKLVEEILFPPVRVFDSDEEERQQLRRERWAKELRR